MKKIATIFGLTALFTLGAPMLATAANVLDPACQGNNVAPLCKENQKSQTTTNNSIYGPNGILTRIVNILSILIGIAGVIAIIIGGFRYVVASGDPGNIDRAKSTILFALIGIAVAVGAQAIILLVIRRL